MSELLCDTCIVRWARIFYERLFNDDLCFLWVRSGNFRGLPRRGRRLILFFTAFAACVPVAKRAVRIRTGILYYYRLGRVHPLPGNRHVSFFTVKTLVFDSTASSTLSGERRKRRRDSAHAASY